MSPRDLDEGKASACDGGGRPRVHTHACGLPIPQAAAGRGKGSARILTRSRTLFLSVLNDTWSQEGRVEGAGEAGAQCLARPWSHTNTQIITQSSHNHHTNMLNQIERDESQEAFEPNALI